MSLEETLSLHLAAMTATFDGVEGELPARLERIRSFARNAGQTVLPVIDNSAEAICSRIDKERDRRIDGGFDWQGHRFQSRPSDRENLLGAAQLAIAAIGAGVQRDNLRWVNPDADFVWITEANDLVPLDAFQVVQLFQIGVAYKTALTFFARTLKDQVLSAEDPTTVEIDTGWPV